MSHAKDAKNAKNINNSRILPKQPGFSAAQMTESIACARKHIARA
jgi:hypothetical protein